MAPSSSMQTLLSPVELSYLHTSLSLDPPIRPDARARCQFRPLIAETDILQGTNGSARICFADGTEAIVGVKAEVEKASSTSSLAGLSTDAGNLGRIGNDREDMEDGEARSEAVGRNEWVEMSIEIPGFRDDDPLPVFIAAMLNEALVASGELPNRLWINRRFHWKLYVDVLLLSPPLSYPLPLLSLTTHLALLSTRLPRLKSELDEDPLFDDDWEASQYLYLRKGSDEGRKRERPPITLLVMAAGSNVVYDPSKEELAVAEAVLAVSIGEETLPVATGHSGPRQLRLLSIRTIDPPSRLTPPGVPNFLNTATGGTAAVSSQQGISQRETLDDQSIWTPPRGGIKRELIGRVIKEVTAVGGIAQEVLDGLEAVDVG